MCMFDYTRSCRGGSMLSKRDAHRLALRALSRTTITAMLLIIAGCGNVSDRLHARVELKKGNQNYLAGNFRDAIDHYDRAIERVPDLSSAFLNRAYSQEALF